MLYDTSGIQQEGRLFQVTDKIGIEQAQHGQSKGRKTGKNQSWKYRSTCENCGIEFAGRAGAANRFCQNNCQHEFSVKRWLECSKCLAKMGIGSEIAGRILGISASTVSRGWKNYGVLAQRPLSGSMAREGRRLISQNRAPTEHESIKAYYGACLSDIRSHKRFPDWSYLWTKEKAKRDSLKKWQALNPIQKKRIGKRQWEKRKKKYQSCPIARKKQLDSSYEWKRRNPDKNRDSQKRAIKKRKAEDHGFKVACNLRHRLKEIMGKVKKGGTEHRNNLTGCTTRQLAKHLESQFKRGMTWDNYGSHWHVDHILPCASFDHTCPRQRAQCWHWTNLRPLEAKKNMAKSATITEPQMQLLLCATH